MDLSQLPKMGETPKPPPPEEPQKTRPPASAFPYREPAAMSDGGGMGAVSVWISLVIGLIFLAMGWNFARWAIAKAGGNEMSTGWLQADGVTPVRYFELQGGTAWSDTAFFAMGVALLLDAALLFVAYRSREPQRAVLVPALAATGLALALNVGVAGYLFKLNIMPLGTLIAVLVGGIMLFEQLGLWKQSRR